MEERGPEKKKKRKETTITFQDFIDSLMTLLLRRMTVHLNTDALQLV